MADFFDKGRGKNIAIDEFPFLFSMQVHTGAFGMIFSGIWFVILFLNYPLFWSFSSAILSAFIALGFLAMIISGALVGQRVVDRGPERDEIYWDRFARVSMTWLIVWFSLVCSTLVWLTGGMSSPFIPFYIMVFTLTLTRCAVPHPGRPLLLLYAVAFLAAGIFAQGLFRPPVDPDVTLAIKQGRAKEWVEFGFAIASMWVPYFSTKVLEAREHRRRARSNSQHADQSGAGVQPAATNQPS